MCFSKFRTLLGLGLGGYFIECHIFFKGKSIFYILSCFFSGVKIYFLYFFSVNEFW